MSEARHPDDAAGSAAAPAGPRRGWLTLRALAPRGMLGRTLLIVLIPLVILQAVALWIFYGSHLDVIYALYIVIVLAYITVLVVQLWGIRVFVRVLRVPPHFGPLLRGDPLDVGQEAAARRQRRRRACNGGRLAAAQPRRPAPDPRPGDRRERANGAAPWGARRAPGRPRGRSARSPTAGRRSSGRGSCSSTEPRHRG